MDFKAHEFVKLKQCKIDVVIFDACADDTDMIKLREKAFKSGFNIFIITDEEKNIRHYACRLEGKQNELEELRREVKERVNRVFANMWNTTGFLSFLSNVHYKNRWFDEKGWDKEIAGNDINYEPATEQQMLFAGSMMEKRADNYTELIRMRTFLRLMQAVDDEFKELDRAKTEAKARQLLLKKDIVCSHIFKDKELKMVRKGRRVCCEPCAAAGYLDPDIDFGKKKKGEVEIGYIKSL
jgi:hypothetical protein